MAENQNSGNNVVSGDFLRVLLALKKNIMRDINVADVCQVKQNNSDDTWTCQSLSDDSSFQATTMVDVQVDVNDIVCVLFMNYDFRSNLKRIQAGQQTQLTTSGSSHSKSAALIIGVVYTTRTNTILKRLSDLEKRLSDLEKRVSDLENKLRR